LPNPRAAPCQFTSCVHHPNQPLKQDDAEEEDALSSAVPSPVASTPEDDAADAAPSRNDAPNSVTDPIPIGPAPTLFHSLTNLLLIPNKI
ncbi:unnamed protein product, partial [Urochloa humidicola]